ncbi:hypothetical protein ACUW9N_000307 [Staphylococcus auricularis]
MTTKDTAEPLEKGLKVSYHFESLVRYIHLKR